VLLVGDIDRGGIFAQLLGTLWLLEPEERGLVRGLVVNKFRGDPALFADGVRMLEERGGVPVLGVVPYLSALAIPEEDAVALDAEFAVPPLGGGESRLKAGLRSAAAIDIAVIQLPHIANFDDFDPLRAEAGVSLRYVQFPAALGRPHAVILPGTKSTSADLAWLRAQGLAEAIRGLAAQGVAVAGICGGYQMLGRVIQDRSHVEAMDSEAQGLGLLPVETTFDPSKATFQARARVVGGPGWLESLAGQEFEGYEIHMGRTSGGRSWLEITRRNGDMVNLTEGAASEDGRVWGCYLHGLFANTALRRAWLASLSESAATGGSPAAWFAAGEPPVVSDALDRLADAVEGALDLRRLEVILGEQD
jgi:adenosylcobyric acid synthase